MDCISRIPKHIFFKLHYPQPPDIQIIIIIIINFAIPGDRNAIRKVAEKILKYKDVVIKKQRMWKVKAKIILVITRATGTISKITQTVPEQQPGKGEIEEKQKKTKKNSLMGHCTLTAGSANVKEQSIFHG